MIRRENRVIQNWGLVELTGKTTIAFLASTFGVDGVLSDGPRKVERDFSSIPLTLYESRCRPPRIRLMPLSSAIRRTRFERTGSLARESGNELGTGSNGLTDLSSCSLEAIAAMRRDG